MATYNEPEFNYKDAVESAAKAIWLADGYDLDADIGSRTNRELRPHYTTLAAAAIEAAISHLLPQISNGIAAEIRAERNAHISVGTQAFGAATQAAAIAQDYGNKRP